ncbi:hypothetical protein [Streptomyces phaeochromogenes]
MTGTRNERELRHGPGRSYSVLGIAAATAEGFQAGDQAAAGAEVVASR